MSIDGQITLRPIAKCIRIDNGMARIKFKDGDVGVIPAGMVPRELRVEMHERNKAFSHASTNRGDA